MYKVYVGFHKYAFVNDSKGLIFYEIVSVLYYKDVSLINIQCAIYRKYWGCFGRSSARSFHLANKYLVTSLYCSNCSCDLDIVIVTPRDPRFCCSLFIGVNLDMRLHSYKPNTSVLFKPMQQS